MSVMEPSATEAESRAGYGRFFAWTAAISLVLLLAMISLEVFFPQGLRFSSESSAAVADALGVNGAVGVDFYDFQLLIVVVALVSGVASIVGLIIVGFIDSVESRKARRRRALEARLRHPSLGDGKKNALSRQPPQRNAGLRALRDVVHDLK